MELLIYLLKHKKTTYRQLAQRFEVSTKTIERDINRLSAMGIPVYCTQGVGGGVQLDKSYQFSTSFFTEADLHQIIFALKIMDSLAETPTQNATLQKLCLIAPELSAMFAYDAAHYLSIDLLCEKIGTEAEVRAGIDACLDSAVYAVINGTLRVAPIGYVLKPDGLYLFCFSDDYRMIKCRTIETLVPTQTPFARTFLSYEDYKNNR